jgi:DNA-binding protein HU-beta
MKIQRPKFIEDLAAKSSMTRTKTEEMVNNFIFLIYYHLRAGNQVNLSGFGKFRVQERHARLGVNPRNPSQRITIPAGRTPRFTAGEAFREAIKQH